MNYCKLLWLKASAKCAWKILLLAELQLKFLNLFFFLKFTYEIHTCHFCWCHDFVSVFDRQSQKRKRRVAQLQLHASEGRERIKWTLQRQHGKLTARLQLRFQTIIPCASHENNKLTASEVLGLFSFFSNLFGRSVYFGETSFQHRWSSSLGWMIQIILIAHTCSIVRG